MIPKVRPWLVRFVRDGATVATVRVETVNRRFARWLALEQFPAGHLIGTRATVARVETNRKATRIPQTRIPLTCPAPLPACDPNAYARVK